MVDRVIVKIVDAAAASWPAELDRLRAELGAPANSLLFPGHFLQATFPKIGGVTLRVEAENGTLLAGCFLFPRDIQEGTQVYTLRYHRARAGGTDSIDPTWLCQRIEGLLNGSRIVFYDPTASHAYRRTSHLGKGIDIGRPDAAEAQAMRALAQEIWETAPDGLYPADIAANDFRAGTALVARLDGEVAGFLLGFVKFGGPVLPEAWRRFDRGVRLESQLLGVSPRFRQHGLGTLLKQAQGRQAAAAGIDVVNWTVDPLQYGNAVLNLGRLRAVAFDFLPDYYPFRNALNRVPASRLAMTWPVRTERVRDALAEAQPAVVYQLAELSNTRRLNDGPEAPVLDACEPMIAIEIPVHWTALQRDDLSRALAWRATTDRLFQRYLGTKPGKYALTDIAVEGERRFLVGRRIDAALLERYGAGAREQGETSDAD